MLKDGDNSGNDIFYGFSNVSPKYDGDNPYLYNTDWNSDESKVWVAYPIGTGSDIAVAHVDISTSMTATKYVRIVFGGSYTFVRVSYIDENSFILYAIVGTTGVVAKVDQTVNASPTIITKYLTDLRHTHFFGKKVTGGILIASAIVGGESNFLTAAQSVIWKASDDLNFTPLNCYDPDSGTETIEALSTTPSLDMGTNMATMFMGQFNTLNASQTETSAPYVTDITNIPIRAQSTKSNNSTGQKCKLQPPAFVIYSDLAFESTNTDPEVDLMASVSQCQGAPMEVTAEVSGLASLPNWIVEDTTSNVLKVVPQSATSADEATYTVIVTAKDTTTVPESNTKSFNVTIAAIGTLPRPTSGSGTTGDSVSSGTFTSKYLNRDVAQTLQAEASIGVLAGVSSASTIGLSAIMQGSVSGVSAGIGQCQIFQVLTLVNMNTPDNVVKTSKSFKTTRMDFYFVDPGFQSNIEDDTKRSLPSVYTGYKDLSNIGFTNGSFLVNYLFFYIILAIVNKCCCSKQRNPRISKFFLKCQQLFEYGFYVHYFIFASLFIFIVALNEIFMPNFETATNIISFILAVSTCILFILLGILPIIWTLCFNRQRSNEDDYTTEENSRL